MNCYTFPIANIIVHWLTDDGVAVVSDDDDDDDHDDWQKSIEEWKRFWSSVSHFSRSYELNGNRLWNKLFFLLTVLMLLHIHF